jgi:hypothetical protein
VAPGAQQGCNRRWGSVCCPGREAKLGRNGSLQIGGSLPAAAEQPHQPDRPRAALSGTRRAPRAGVRLTAAFGPYLSAITSPLGGDVAFYTPLAYNAGECTHSSNRPRSSGFFPYTWTTIEYSELQQFMMQNPEAGQVVPGSGGVRKLRWKRPGMGKRGGLR